MLLGLGLRSLLGWGWWTACRPIDVACLCLAVQEACLAAIELAVAGTEAAMAVVMVVRAARDAERYQRHDIAWRSDCAAPGERRRGSFADPLSETTLCRKSTDGGKECQCQALIALQSVWWPLFSCRLLATFTFVVLSSVFYLNSATKQFYSGVTP